MGERLVLWDIDKTLVDVESVGGSVFSAAFTAFSGLDDYVPSRGPGRTEWQWFLDTLAVNNLTHLAEGFPRFLRLQDVEFRRRATELRARGRVLPGAREALERCAASPDVLSSLLTGNAVGNAHHKLQAFGLESLVETRLGGYGDDHWNRSELVGIARRRVHEATGLEFTPATTVLVGDTPNDVRAALEGGARVVAVATGYCDADTLRAAGATTVLDDLSDTEAVMEALLA
ncbi:HAD family hydrolase [Thermobifida halotolerans]|uniref:HAD family hydrolase n=1 Tax=Thermobifida halotolerans TaxID=483545 RepID=A0A399G2I9_9ACTN|nr:haloacid dehalogenase-like hydrolase [Thermobifida halotolerans]UOE18088.1 HAD family hydrolase [Thermobifida halotolerans]